MTLVNTVASVICTWDEARMAPLAIESTKDFVDEYIVVDAGSVDGTRKVINECADRWDLKISIYDKPDMRLRFARMFAIEQTDADWILIQDGDEIFHTDGPNSIHNLRTMLDKENVVYRAPMNYLYRDLLHTQKKKTRLPGHMFLYHNNGTFSLRPAKRDLPGYKGNLVNLEKVYKFNCNVKSPKRMFLRNHWYDWSKTDAHETYTIEEFVRRKLDVPDLTPVIEEWYNKRMGENLVRYDETKYGYYPKVIREYIERGLIYGNI